MPQFVTDIRTMHRATDVSRTPADRHGVSSAYRTRLAALRERAPDTLRARVRHALREATTTIARTE